MKLVFLLLCVSLLGACAQLAPKPVAPWERGNLAKASMQFDANPLESALSEHLRASKEAASGGSSVGGGGCGCN
jgi:Domain of unknown function (DUF4266)